MFKKIIFIFTAIFLLENCSSVERGVKEALSDVSIKGQIEHLWFATKKDFYRELTISVNEKRVLIAGKVKSTQDHVDAIRLAWQADGVIEIIDQISIGEYSWSSYAEDAWTTLQIRNAFLFEKGLTSSHFNIFTFEGSVYLLGVADSQKELDKALTLARTIKNVKQVISYVKLHENTKG
jgi:osmotically-inducible protein OsmY